MRFLKLTGLTLLVLLLLPFLAVQLFGGSIARQVVRALNSRLQTEIVIEEYDLSLLRSFPYLSADLRGVTVEGSDGSELLAADRLGCLLDLSSLFGKVRITGIRIENGKLQLFTDRDGNTNYQLAGYTSVGDQGADAGARAVEFAAERARLRNVVLVYQDARLKTDVLLTVADATFSGDFGNREYVLQTHAELRIAYVDQDGYRYLDQQDVTLESTTTVNNEVGGYAFAPLHLQAGDLELEATGYLTPTDDGLTTALTISSSSGNLEDVLQLVPPAYAGALTDLETRGSLLLSAAVNGAWTSSSYPRIDGRLSFADGRVGSPRMDVSARDLDLQATFAYLDGPRGGVQTFAIEQLTGTFSGEPFDLKLRLEDLEDPRITFSADGSLPLSTLIAFLGNDRLSGVDGLLRFRGLTLGGRYADMVVPRQMGRVSSTGLLTLEDGEVTLGDQTIYLPEGTLELSDNRLSVTGLAVRMDETDLQFSGTATNLIPVLFADSLNSQDAALQFEATLTGSRLDLKEVLSLSGPADSVSATAPAPRAPLTDFLNGRFAATLDAWSWDKMHGEEFRGELEFRPGRLDVRGMSAAMDGQFRLDATSYFQLPSLIEARVAAEGVDAEEFFYQSGNFDQEVLTSENIEGSMNARLLLDIYYDSLGTVDYDRLHVLASVEILDGELHDFAMLENFAFALKSGDLERVRFTRLANFFEIADGTLYIPSMYIQSSAINLTLSGSHTFDQYLDYYVKVNAGQVIANKISRHDDRLEVLPARNGLFNLYYTIKGPLENYAVESDKRAVKVDFQRSESRRDRIRRALEIRFQTPIELRPPTGEEDTGE